MRRALSTVAISAIVLTGCGGAADDATENPSTSRETSASPSTPPPSPRSTEDDDDGEAPTDGASDGSREGGIEIEIEIEGDRIEPNGKRVSLEAGERILLEIESDRAGELHVHSTPEKEIPFKLGDSMVELKVDTPGIVDVEEHESGTVLLQLEVR